MMATRTPSPAQLAARARFAEMARNGSLNRKRQIAAKKRAANPAPKHKTIQHGIDYAIKRFADSMQHWMDEGYTFDEAFQRVSASSTLGPASIKKALAMLGYATNPRKKTVSQKISQLVHEGYPQKQAVAVALNEQRAGKVKRNPTSGMVKGFAVVCMHPNPHTVAITTSMSDAKKIGQDYATRENVQVAIKPVDVHASHFA
jgi:hypothetical protein